MEGIWERKNKLCAQKNKRLQTAVGKNGDKRGAYLTNIKGVKIAQLSKNVHVFFLFVHF